MLVDIENMDRDDLMKYCYDLEARIEALTTADLGHEFTKILLLVKNDGFHPQVACLINYLISGKLKSHESILAAISKQHVDDVSLRPAGTSCVVPVIVCRARKFLKKYDAEITNVIGRGYIIRPKSIAKIKTLLETPLNGRRCDG